MHRAQSDGEGLNGAISATPCALTQQAAKVLLLSLAAQDAEKPPTSGGC